jgi:ribosome-binding factor A
MSWSRVSRLEAQLKEKVAIVVLERLGDPRLGFITITGVRLSEDKKLCRVFYTVLGTEKQAKLTAKALGDAAPHIQEKIAPTLRSRSVPKLRFVYDETVEKESRMNTLLDKLAAERPPEPDPEVDADADTDPETAPADDTPTG